MNEVRRGWGIYLLVPKAGEPVMKEEEEMTRTQTQDTETAVVVLATQRRKGEGYFT